MKNESLKNQRKQNLALVTIAGLTLALTVLVTSTSEARERHDRRQAHQAGRVQQGVKSDEITAAELHRLQKSKRAIRRTEKRFENNDGEIGKKEALILEQMQDARSKQIHRLKHNDKTRKDDVTLPGEPSAAPAADSAPAANADSSSN